MSITYHVLFVYFLVAEKICLFFFKISISKLANHTINKMSIVKYMQTFLAEKNRLDDMERNGEESYSIQFLVSKSISYWGYFFRYRSYLLISGLLSKVKVK